MVVCATLLWAARGSLRSNQWREQHCKASGQGKRTAIYSQTKPQVEATRHKLDYS